MLASNTESKQIVMPNNPPRLGNTILIGLVILSILGIFILAYLIVRGEQDLSSYQTFITVILAAIVTGVGGLFLKITSDKNKQIASNQAYEEKQNEAQRSHEEKLEQIRVQTNGRLHKRDEQLEAQSILMAKQVELISILITDNDKYRKAELGQLNSIEKKVSAQTEALIIIPENHLAILKKDIKKQQKTVELNNIELDTVREKETD